MRHLIVRLLRSIIVLFGVVAFVFVLMRMAPGDPITMMAGPTADPATVESLRSSLGLDRPLSVQLIIFLGNFVRGDLGDSLVSQSPVIDLILRALPQTIYLSACALLVAILIAVPAGIWSALRPGSLGDRAAEAMILAAQSLPAFWISIILIYFFAVKLGWLPSSGNETWSAVILPAFTLSIFQLPLLTRTVRSTTLSIASQDYVKAAFAKGLSTPRILGAYVFMNMLVPITTVIALQAGTMLSGAVVTEAVFAWPGLGTLAMSSLLARDYPMVQAIVLFSASIVILLNIAADAVSVILDPRLRD
ncbi:MAG: ABC transporter permease [Rhizobiaceae bacterium]